MSALAVSHVYPLGSRLNERGRLEVGGCDVVELAAEFGTPAYVYAEDDMRARARSFVEAFRARAGHFEVVYASKAFPCTAAYRLFAEEGLSADVASGGELHLALAAGMDPERLYMHGNNKSQAELDYATESGLGHIVVDSFDEIERLRGREQRVLLRVTPGIEPSTHEFIQTGQVDSKFGFQMEEVDRGVEACGDAGLELCGLHAHIGSQILDLDVFERRTKGLAYTRTGEGPTVVLLHGLTCNAAYWLRVVPLLDGLCTIAVDLRGHGLSEHRESYGYADYQRDALALIDELDVAPAVLAGHSLGGYVALRAAAADDRIRAVLAADVKSDWTEADAMLAERVRDASQRIEPDRNTLVDRLARPLQAATLGTDELEEIAARSVETAAGGWRYRWDRRVLATEPVDPFPFLSQVRCAACVIAGSESDVMPRESAERFADAIPGAELELVDGVGHHVELEAPDRIAARIRELVT